jgi:nicotinate-nucleotide adenylyltransferase
MSNRYVEELGILAITSSPPHNGHTRIATAVIDSGLVNQVWVVPTYEHPGKENLPDYSERLEMTQLAVQDLPRNYRKRIFAKDIESGLPVPSFTHATLSAIAQDGRYKPILIIGSDYFNPETGEVIPGWIQREKIIARGMIMVPRKYHPVVQADLPDSVRLVVTNPIDGCSVDARQATTYEELIASVCPAVA